MRTLRLGSIFSLVVIAATSPARADEPSANRIAREVQHFYDRTKTFKASFKQHFVLKAYAKKRDSQGVVVFAKPGKMSFRYTNNPNRVVSDGKTIKIYEADNRQMIEQPVGKSQYPAVLAFLVGGGKLTRAFKLRKLPGDHSGLHRLSGTPKEPTAAYRNIVLYVDAKTYHVRRVIVLDAQGNRNRFDFANPSVNQKISASEFAFKPPAGTQVLRP